jgi:hypothetical protein
MPYFPRREESAYNCRGCNEWYIPGGVSCLVSHPPGTCCHYGETSILPPAKVREKKHADEVPSSGRPDAEAAARAVHYARRHNCPYGEQCPTIKWGGDYDCLSQRVGG